MIMAVGETTTGIESESENEIADRAGTTVAGETPAVGEMADLIATATETASGHAKTSMRRKQSGAGVHVEKWVSRAMRAREW